MRSKERDAFGPEWEGVQRRSASISETLSPHSDVDETGHHDEMPCTLGTTGDG